MRRERVGFYADCVEPLKLEGIIEMPEEGGIPPACILCHPHPMGGGSMYVPLIETMAAVMVVQGWACLRFNFRGVGGSGGECSGGLREVEDVEGAYRFLQERDDVAVDDIALAGWSFGSWVGLRWAAKEGRCGKVALVSPPLVGFDFFHFIDSGEAVLPADTLIVSGSRDQFSDPEKLRELADRIGGELRLVEGADHFLFGREREIAHLVADHWKSG